MTNKSLSITRTV